MDWTGQPYQTPIRISMEDGCGCWAAESSNPIDSTYGIIGITVPSSSSRPWSRKIASRHVLRFLVFWAVESCRTEVPWGTHRFKSRTTGKKHCCDPCWSLSNIDP
jgi:hypothetical protein